MNRFLSHLTSVFGVFGSQLDQEFILTFFYNWLVNLISVKTSSKFLTFWLKDVLSWDILIICLNNNFDWIRVVQQIWIFNRCFMFDLWFILQSIFSVFNETLLRLFFGLDSLAGWNKSVNWASLVVEIVCVWLVLLNLF